MDCYFISNRSTLQHVYLVIALLLKDKTMIGLEHVYLGIVHVKVLLSLNKFKLASSVSVGLQRKDGHGLLTFNRSTLQQVYVVSALWFKFNKKMKQLEHLSATLDVKVTSSLKQIELGIVGKRGSLAQGLWVGIQSKHLAASMCCDCVVA